MLIKMFNDKMEVHALQEVMQFIGTERFRAFCRIFYGEGRARRFAVIVKINNFFQYWVVKSSVLNHSG